MQWRDKKWSCTSVLTAINVLVFLLFQLFSISKKEEIEGAFALSNEGILRGEFWQFFSYQFLHGTLLHLLVNMLALSFVGHFMEKELGARRFLILYLLGGAVGGGLQLLFQADGTALVGASAAVCAVFLSFCTLYPNQRITALIFFIIPVQLRAKILGWGITIASLAFAWIGWPPGIGNLAHLGGCILGFCLTKLWMQQGSLKRANSL